MEKVHGRIIKGMRHEPNSVHSDVMKAYFQLYALLANEKVSRTRIISTAEGVVHWLRP